MTKEVASGQALGQTQEGYSGAIRNQAGVQATNSAGSANDAFAIRGIKLNLFSNYRLDGGLPIAGVIGMTPFTGASSAMPACSGTSRR